MLNNQLNPPLLNEIEVSIFGPGYGEAIIIHIGQGKWILVDSCIESKSKLPISVKYLRDLGVDLASAVKLIVATHWHDDHVRGISSIYEQCHAAKLVVSDALRVNEFLTLVELYHDSGMMLTSGVDEFARAIKIVSERKHEGVRLIPASVDKLLFRDNVQLINGNITEVKIFALSPSHASVLQSRVAFANLLPKENEFPKRVLSPKPNHTSVVLLIEIGDHSLLLGSDLEVTSDPNTGWSVILNDSSAISRKSQVFKIPHHGSGNAHHEDVWIRLLTSNPIAMLTPYNRGRKPLPSPHDIERINNLTSSGYATTPTKQKRQKWRNSVVRDFVEQSTKSIKEVNQGWGHIRLRNSIKEKNNKWDVELFGDAYSLHALN